MDYKLRQSAKEDAKEIGRYTFSKFGVTQRDKYLFGLEAHFKKFRQCLQDIKLEMI